MTNGGRIKPVHNEHGGDPRFADPAMSAGRAFAKHARRAASGRSGGGKRRPRPVTVRGAAPAPGMSRRAASSARSQSPPLVQVIDWMLEQSDNTIAEAMGRQVALAAGEPASFDGATEAMLDKLRELGLTATRRTCTTPAACPGTTASARPCSPQPLALAAGGTSRR